MPKKGENIYKRKDGRWEGRYIRSYAPDGKAKYGYVYGHTYNEVKQSLIDRKSVTQHNLDITDRRSITYSEVLDMWLASSRINIKESTYARYTHLVKTHIEPYLGQYQLSKITADIIGENVENQLSQGRLDNSGGLSPKTVTDLLTIIKNTMEYAKCRNFLVTCNLRKLSVKKRENEMRVLTTKEQDALMRTLLRDLDLYKFGVLLSLYTGIRIGELCALQWKDISLDEATLKIRKTMQRIQDCEQTAKCKTKVIITEPKSQCSVRDIPLPAFICEIAKPLVSTPDDYILSGSSTRYVEPRTMQNRFKSYVTESGIVLLAHSCNGEAGHYRVGEE